MQRFERFFDWRVMIETVDLIEVDIIHAEPTQAVVDLGRDPLARQAGAIGAGTHPAIDLGGNDNLFAAREILDSAAEDFFAAAKRIAVRSVEEVDPSFERLLDKRAALLLAQAPGVIAAVAAAIAHATEADARDIEACAAELGIFHGYLGQLV